MIAKPYRRVTNALSRRWTDHRDRWSNCDSCPLARSRSRVVLFRGRLPADVLFLGEAPGDSEDTFGAPFLGESGDFLQGVLDEIAGTRCVSGQLFFNGPLSYAITNIVACRPPRVDGKLRAPKKEEAASCAPRLKEFLRMCKPSLVVCLGTVATNNLPHKTPRIELRHPAWVLRQPEAKQPIYRQQFLVRLKEGLEEVGQG